MKRLSELLDNVQVLEIENSTNPEISGLEYDSRRVEKNSPPQSGCNCCR